MSASTASLYVALQQQTVYVRVVGKANFACAVDFKSLVDSLRNKGYQRFALDLRDCPLMDSTFIGLLTGLGMQVTPSSEENAESGISLHHANERILNLLENLGVEHLFMACSSGDGIPDNLNDVLAERNDHSQVEMQRTCLKAHQTLMEVNPDNVPKFKDVTRFLEEDLKKAQQPEE